VSLSHVVERGATDPLVLDSGAVTTQDKLLRGGCEFRETGNGQILMVKVGIVAKDVVCLR
jgi:hypothetical protein